MLKPLKRLQVRKFAVQFQNRESDCELLTLESVGKPVLRECFQANRFLKFGISDSDIFSVGKNARLSYFLNAKPRYLVPSEEKKIL